MQALARPLATAQHCCGKDRRRRPQAPLHEGMHATQRVHIGACLEAAAVALDDPAEAVRADAVRALRFVNAPKAGQLLQRVTVQHPATSLADLASLTKERRALRITRELRR